MIGTNLNDLNELLLCPFCGNKPKLETEGTFIEIFCCVTMSRQKSDYLNLKERESWDDERYKFGVYEEYKALSSVIKEWNKRVK